MAIKICPFCGAENEQDAVNCQLCNLEFELNDTIQTIQPSLYNYTNPSEQSAPSENPLPVTSEFPESITESGNHNTVLYIIISVLVLIIIAGAVIGFQYFKHNSNQEFSASVPKSETDIQEITDPMTEVQTEAFTTAPATEPETEEPTTVPETKLETETPITVSPTEKPSVAETVPVTEARKPPEISCEIKVQGSEQYDGYSYTLSVNGKYDYYYIECNEYSAGTPNEPYLVLSGNKSDSSLYLTAGSSLDHVTVSVTPYYSDGTKGKTVSCTQSQPAPKVTSVPMPSTCLYMGTGTPVSSDGFLNLRSSKSTSSDSNIITQIPNGASISMYSINDSSWIYVEYGSYSGYVKESYTKLTDPQGLWADGPGDDEDTAVSTESCYAIGEINGSSVSGYTTSYVVNGGPKSKVRDRLGDGWHVTAYTRCYSHGITWYEVYDTDDGDYYGWVSSYCITFYGG